MCFPKLKNIPNDFVLIIYNWNICFKSEVYIQKCTRKSAMHAHKCTHWCTHTSVRTDARTQVYAMMHAHKCTLWCTHRSVRYDARTEVYAMMHAHKCTHWCTHTSVRYDARTVICTTTVIYLLYQGRIWHTCIGLSILIVHLLISIAIQFLFLF